jgi:hypothetical protein
MPTHCAGSTGRTKTGWADLIGAVVGEVFSTAEVDDGTANPLRLNSEGRMRWLCERTLQSARNDAAIVEKVALMESQHVQSSAKLDEMKTDVDEMKADVDEKLEKMNEQLERIATMLAPLAGGGAGS